MRNLDEYIARKEDVKIRYLEDERPKDPQPGQVIIKSAGQKTVFRRKCIIIEDQQKIYLPQLKQSKILSCRNPFKADEQLINYELDTEDEIEEENGEDINDENYMSDDDENDLEENELAKGFIVEDDYLSISEMNYSENSQANVDLINEDKERRRLMRLKNRESKNINPDSYEDGP